MTLKSIESTKRVLSLLRVESVNIIDFHQEDKERRADGDGDRHIYRERLDAVTDEIP